MAEAAQAQEGQPEYPKTVTLAEQGARLPLGIRASDGAYRKDIAVRPWRMKEERELGRIRDQNKDANVAQFVSMVLSAMCTRLGPHDFESMSKPEERQVHVSQMFMGDVFYAYIWLRIQAMGHELGLDVTCPRCRHSYPFVADLNTVETVVVENEEQARWEYELKAPFEVRGKTVERLMLGPSRWNGLEMMSGNSISTGEAKAGIIRSSIVGLGTPDWDVDEAGNLRPLVLTDAELDEMAKRDIEAITNSIEKHAVGPNMAVEDKCNRCGAEIKLAIDWGYDNFFGDSSR